MKVLLWDLETIGVNALKADLGAVAVFGWKWLGDEKTHAYTLEEYKGFTKYGFDDSRLLTAATRIMEEADLLVAHYGDKFDRRFFQGRCAIHGLTPPPPTKQRDTCLIARRAFNYSSNRLGALANTLNLKEKKIDNSNRRWPDWWLRVMAGDRTALKSMADYCKQDVRTLEQVYLRLRPFDLPHPRIAEDPDRLVCATCGGRIEYRGVAHVGVYTYRRFRCLVCGRWGRLQNRIK